MINEILEGGFSHKDISWKPQMTGITAEGKPYAQLITYADARAYQKRLDETFGKFGWQTTYREFKHGIICNLSVLYEGEWISKEDGSEFDSGDNIDNIKAACSNSFKRVCSSGFGIGRYLYDMPIEWAIFCEKYEANSNRIKIKSGSQTKVFHYKDPLLKCYKCLEKDVYSNEDKTKFLNVCQTCHQLGQARESLGRAVKEEINA